MQKKPEYDAPLMDRVCAIHALRQDMADRECHGNSIDCDTSIAPVPNQHFSWEIAGVFKPCIGYL
jgi:hypothetical protein